jgi:hypothetical protein
MALAAAPAGAASMPCKFGEATQQSSGSAVVAVRCSTGGKLAWRDASGHGLLRPLSSGYDVADPPPAVRLKPSARGLAKLRRTCRLRVRVRFAFTPTEGAPVSTTRAYTLRRGRC